MRRPSSYLRFKYTHGGPLVSASGASGRKLLGAFVGGLPWRYAFSERVLGLVLGHEGVHGGICVGVVIPFSIHTHMR